MKDKLIYHKFANDKGQYNLFGSFKGMPVMITKKNDLWEFRLNNQLYGIFKNRLLAEKVSKYLASSGYLSITHGL